MKYEKVAQYILKQFYKGEVLPAESVDKSMLVVIDNVAIARFPGNQFPFSAICFKAANLSNITKEVEENSIEAHLTNRYLIFDKRKITEIEDETGRLFYIDSKILDLFKFEDPVFYVHKDKTIQPILIYDMTNAGTTYYWQAAIYYWQAAIMPVKEVRANE